jgi:hypothetical protein
VRLTTKPQWSTDSPKGSHISVVRILFTRTLVKNAEKKRKKCYPTEKIPEERIQKTFPEKLLATGARGRPPSFALLLLSNQHVENGRKNHADHVSSLLIRQTEDAKFRYLNAMFNLPTLQTQHPTT